MTALRIPTAPVFVPLLQPARYKAAYGGRGSGKSNFFADLAIEDAMRWPGDAGEGLRLLCFREHQKDLSDSAKTLIERRLVGYGLGERDGWKIFRDVIQCPGDGVMRFIGMKDHTADSVKSYDGFHRGWGEEAHTNTAHSLGLIRPTLRWEDKDRGLFSELWFSWNPRLETDAVDALFRGGEPPTGSVVVKANWRDNPWFPSVLEQERLDCLANNPGMYGHIWEGEYVTVQEGAYYAECLHTARAEGRIGHVGRDPLMALYAVWDIGGTGAKADACSIWVCQMVGAELRFIDYHEAVGQPLAYHVDWLRAEGYDRAECVLPHDGAANDKVHAVSYESALRQAGFSVRVIPNMGAGAAKRRVEAARRRFPTMRFDETKCSAGLSALGWYHAKIDPKRRVDLGPEHDWSSHGADAFGLAAVAVELRPVARPIKYGKLASIA